MITALTIYRSYLAEVNFTVTPANGNKVYLLDIPELRNVPIYGVEAFCGTELTLSPQQKVMATSLKGVVLTLAYQSDERFQQWPCYSLEASQNGGIVKEIRTGCLDIPKCYVTIFDATTLLINQSICFNFYYKKK